MLDAYKLPSLKDKQLAQVEEEQKEEKVQKRLEARETRSKLKVKNKKEK